MNYACLKLGTNTAKVMQYYFHRISPALSLREYNKPEKQLRKTQRISFYWSHTLL